MASSAENEHDQKLAGVALRKQKEGKTPSRAELAALTRIRAAKEEEDRWKYYDSIPKKHYLQMSGRQQKVLDEQAAKYGAPLLGPVLRLPAILRWFHDFLSENGPLLLRTVGGDNLLNGDVQDSPALERLREETWLLKRLERQEKEKILLPRDQVHEGLVRIANRMRSCGDQLQKQYGPDSLDILNEALDDVGREIGELFERESGDEPRTEALSHRGGDGKEEDKP